MAALRQQALDFGPADHFACIHDGHPFPVAVATKDGAAVFTQRLYEHDDARLMLVNLVADGLNTYMSSNGFALVDGRRTIGQVRALTSLWVDLDHYNILELAGLTAEQLLDRAMGLAPWLPLPTLLVDSGRGAYFVWALDRPLSAEHLAEWQMVEDALVALLEPLGADASAKDAARILRVAGSMHLVAGERVSVQRIGDPVRFEDVRRLVVEHGAVDALQARRNPRPLLEPVPGGSVFQKPGKGTGKALRAYKLAESRMADIRRLAELRGVPLTDHRKRMLFCYAVACAWFAGSVHQLRDELEDFADTCFAEPGRYRSRQVQAVIDRFIEDGYGKVVRLAVVQNEGRYRMRNATIIRWLGITKGEQRHLRTLISTEEKMRRLTEKRRATGMLSREQYRDRADSRRVEARRMRSEGLSVPEIATALGVALSTAYALLKD